MYKAKVLPSATMIPSDIIVTTRYQNTLNLHGNCKITKGIFPLGIFETLQKVSTWCAVWFQRFKLHCSLTLISACVNPCVLLLIPLSDFF